MTMVVTFIEHADGQPTEAALQALTLARRLAQAWEAPLHAIAMGPANVSVAETLAAYGVAELHLAQHEALAEYAPAAWARAVAAVLTHGPRAVVAAGTDRGSEIMAYVAARAGLPLAAQCVDAQAGDPLTVTRVRWGGSLLEEARVHGAVKLLTVAPHAVPAEPLTAPAAIAITSFVPEITAGDQRARVARRVAAEAGRVSLAEAKVVVGGGRGVSEAANFRLLEELAGLLGGAVGCSRAITSLGWRPHSDQIGQTGTRIAPELYIACGISGAIQHMVGCKGAKHLLAINTDKDAPIVAQADFAIIGDLHTVLPALCEALRQTPKA